jgi:hypothetical protein
MKNVKKAYMTPMVEVMNARVEKGFAGSGSVTPTPGPTPGDGFMGGIRAIDVNAADFD